jgi:hypothetical protein
MAGVRKSRVEDGVGRSVARICGVGAAWSRKKDNCIGRVAMVERREEREGVGRRRPVGVGERRRRLWWREGEQKLCRIVCSDTM